MDKKINVITLILVILIILILGIAIGYLITININNKQIIKEDNNKNINVQAEPQTENVVELPKYDGSKNITVNQKTYTVSYRNELCSKENEEEKIFSTTIYLNDKKLKSYTSYYRFDNNNLELTTIIGDTEYIVISVKAFASSSENVYLIIVNQEGELVDTVQVHYANLGISVHDIPDIEGYTYKIYNDNIIFYKSIGQPITKNGTEYYVAVYKITVEKNNIIYKLERLCTLDEVTFSGK